MEKVFSCPFFEIFPGFSYREKKEISKMIVMLPGAGCSYHKQTGGCSMCGFHEATKKYSFGLVYPSFVFNKMFNMALAKGNKLGVEAISVFNGGSFWNDKEIPVKFQNSLFENFAANSSASEILIESRCEYISEKKIIAAKKSVGNKNIVVAIGLESQDDYVRNSLVKKGLSKKNFEKSILLLKENGLDSMAYVFLKPLGLSEKEALNDCLQTIEYALSVGVSRVALSSAFIQKGTDMWHAYLDGSFYPPNLWTILSILDEAKKNSWPLELGGFSDEPPPIDIPRACPKCSDGIYAAMDNYRRYGFLGEVPICNCFK